MNSEQNNNDLLLAINTLEHLINQGGNNEYVLNAVTRYKSKGHLDKFTLYKINQKLRNIEKNLKFKLQ